MGRGLNVFVTCVLFVVWSFVLMQSGAIVASVSLSTYVGVVAVLLALSFFAFDKIARRHIYSYSLSTSTCELRDDGIQFEPKDKVNRWSRVSQIRVFAWDNIGEYELYESRFLRWMDIELVLLDGDKVEIIGRRNERDRAFLADLFREIRLHKAAKKLPRDLETGKGSQVSFEKKMT